MIRLKIVTFYLTHTNIILWGSVAWYQVLCTQYTKADVKKKNRTTKIKPRQDRTYSTVLDKEPLLQLAASVRSRKRVVLKITDRGRNGHRRLYRSCSRHRDTGRSRFKACFWQQINDKINTAQKHKRSAPLRARSAICERYCCALLLKEKKSARKCSNTWRTFSDGP